ncbi:hypothetical protein OG331_47475 [Streptomyces sp. NBC_01017]|uniref:hypothetical protein n=1 Tax=Streptomyces sp. NBC_01017 TaxID=2903721 RepID=UPI00386D896D|nr:hypothetical protein OG331_04505 [Streptomyces sp. NBC_01017]WSV34718.1 hypothetical protein OG331_47475 [Streptomyces sp. NBC_01017]
MTRVDRQGSDGPLRMTALDRLGNREIQKLMADYNTADALSRLVQKKKEESEKDMLDKIG